MGRIVVHGNVTVDGVVQDPTGEEGFAYGAGSNGCPTPTAPSGQGRVPGGVGQRGPCSSAGAATAGSPDGGPTDEANWADQLRKLPKYTFSPSTLQDPTGWGEATVLRGDAIEEITKLKQSVDGDIIVYASGVLVQTLLEHDLVDEWRLMDASRIVLGAGARLFPATGGQKPLRLVAVRPVGEKPRLAHLPAGPRGLNLTRAPSQAQTDHTHPAAPG
jgi:hypothetical protein